MSQLWGAAYPAVAPAPLVRVAAPVGTGPVHYQNVDLALNSAGRAALMAQQVSSLLFLPLPTMLLF
jgi:hypothetical protein